MSSLTKRQQMRNERALYDLIKAVPGNSTCADCAAPNPAWASWSLGIFLCMRCAAIHRKLGTHISKVKSLSMDSWSVDQVDNMKKVGNVTSNRVFNPANKKPPVPIDVDEADSTMERYIRQKYQERTMQGGHQPSRRRTGSRGSDDPPPLPPKPTNSFSARSATANLQRPESPPQNKPSRVFGASVGESETLAGEDLEKKLIRLRDMGFADEHKNRTILKGLGGDVEKTVEALVRLGELSSPRARAPLSPLSPLGPLSPAVGLTLDKPANSPKGNNPWEVAPAAAPTVQRSSTNPFELSTSRSQYDLNAAFQNMSVNTQAPPLFPHHTGGAPVEYPQQPQSAPPVPMIPQQYYGGAAPNPFVQQLQQPQSQPVSPAQSYNPFMVQQQPPQPPQQAPSMSTNPFGQFQASPVQSPGISYAPQQHHYFAPVQTAASPAGPNPWATAQYQPQRPAYVDKSSIMALYGNAPLQQTPPNVAAPPARSLTAPVLTAPPAAGPVATNNPFANASTYTSPIPTPTTATHGGSRHISQESISVEAGGWHNGRHSPDFFSSLSARSGR